MNDTEKDLWNQIEVLRIHVAKYKDRITEDRKYYLLRIQYLREILTWISREDIFIGFRIMARKMAQQALLEDERYEFEKMRR